MEDSVNKQIADMQKDNEIKLYSTIVKHDEELLASKNEIIALKDELLASKDKIIDLQNKNLKLENELNKKFKK